MQTVLDTCFDDNRLPSEWFDEARRATFKDGRLLSGSACRPMFALPDGAWRRVRVETWVNCTDRSSIAFGTERVILQANFAGGRHCVTAHDGKTLASNLLSLQLSNAKRLVAFTFDRGQWQAAVDGQTVIAYRQHADDCIAGLVSIAFCGDCVVHRVRVAVDDSVSSRLQTIRRDPDRDFRLEVTVDFPDDLSYAPYTQAMLDQLFAEYATWGVRRCHWIYDEKDNWWQYFQEPIYANYLKTKDNLGGDIFRAAVEAAHRHGIELYGIFKPFEMGYMLNTHGEGTPLALERGRFSRIGGVISRCADHVIHHRELMTCRKPGSFGPAENETFTRIELVSDQPGPAAFRAEEVRLFVSDDNNTYRPYEGTIDAEEVMEETGNPSRQNRVIRLKDLEIRSPFLAVTAPGHASSFGNALGNLIRIFGRTGREHRFTLGIVPRAGKLSYDIKTATVSDSQGLDFCNFGIEFDNLDGTPSACLTGYDGMTEWHALDGRNGFIGIARGKDRDAVAVMSPAFIETRQWWLEWVRDILEAGADGVDIRMRSHQTHLYWGEFGFEAPVREAFMQQHGIDIWATDDFDRAAWRRLRGEYYTEFYREARALINSFGRKMSLHISRTMDIEPEVDASMAMHFDWRTWLEEGLADSVTAKEVWPGTVFANEILSYARPKGVDVIFSRFANNIWRLPGGVAVCARRIEAARAFGFDGFQFYESCAVMRAHEDGRLTMEEPELAELFRSQFKWR